MVNMTSAVLFVLSLIKIGSAALTQRPSIAEALVGETAIFKCSTSLKSSEIQWFHYPIQQNSQRQLVYGYGQLTSNYKRLKVNRDNITGSYNLIIPSVNLVDAGKYECQDDYGRGEKASADLVVINAVPVCQSATDLRRVVGENNCGIEPDHLSISCIVQYTGNEPPLMKWTIQGSGGGSQEAMPGSPLTPTVIGGKVIAYNQTMKADSVKNGSSFECSATRSSASTNSKCQTQNITIISRIVSTETEDCICDCPLHPALIFLIIFVVMSLLVGVVVVIVWYFRFYRKKEKLRKEDKDNEAKKQIQIGSQEPNNSGDDLNDEKKRNKENEAEILIEESETDIEKLKRQNRRRDNIIKEKDNDIKEKDQKIKEKDNIIKENDYKIKQLTAKVEEFEKLKAENSHLKKKLSESKIRIGELESRIREIEEAMYRPDEDKYTDKPSLVHTIITEDGQQLKKAINGLAVLGKSLFISHQKTNEIEVYDSITYLLQNRLKASKLSELFDITACIMKSCLFAIGKLSGDENDSSQILRIDSDGKVLNEWYSGGKHGSLSTYISNVIVCLFDKMQINEFDAEGKPIHTVPLSPSEGFRHLAHAIKVTGRHYVVCHGETEGGLHRVCVVNHNGKIVREYPEQSKRKFKYKLEVPVFLLEDREKSILVADKNGINLFSSHLGYQRMLIDQNSGDKLKISNVYYPNKISLDESGKRMFAAVNRLSSSGVWKDGKVFVFSVK